MTTTSEGTSAASTPVSERLAQLRSQAADDPSGAQESAWAWIEELGKRAESDRAGAESQLGELFKLGTTPVGLEGETQGILVTPLIHPLLDKLGPVFKTFWMPWVGKRFDPEKGGGDNLMAGSAKWPLKLIWPRYGTKEHGDRRTAFDFETRVEPGKADPEVEVLVIDYAPVESNPSLVIRSIRDELVKLVPDTYLGKILFATSDDWPCIGYFALRQPAETGT
jgi:hypothetical protein